MPADVAKAAPGQKELWQWLHANGPSSTDDVAAGLDKKSDTSQRALYRAEKSGLVTHDGVRWAAVVEPLAVGQTASAGGTSSSPTSELSTTSELSKVSNACSDPFGSDDAGSDRSNSIDGVDILDRVFAELGEDFWGVAV